MTSNRPLVFMYRNVGTRIAHNLSFFMVKSITLHMSHSASALHEQSSSHFLSPSHSLKFLNCFSSLLTALKSSTRLVSLLTNCYPFCHMNTSWSSGSLLILAAISSSNVTIFSFCLLATFLGTLTVSGRKLAEMGVSPVAIDRSNSLTLLGTKYSIRGSAPPTASPGRSCGSCSSWGGCCAAASAGSC
jgi:hypothetical protein